MQTQPTIKLSLIDKGNNPRTFFDPEELMSLTASVRESGIIQPILVRPVNGRYQIVAGERRYRAAFTAFGEDYDMPVSIRQMSDHEADVAALVENVQRAGMSPTEEAAAAAKLVGHFKGDRDEAAIRLGLSRQILDRRLALMNCSKLVQTSLNERQILIGHAEILAALAKDTQDKFLPIIIQEKKTVAELKATVEKAACKLDSAIFEKTECNGCPHNSSVQTSMFEQSITEGNCTNPTCFKTKTEAQVNSIAEDLKDEYPVIRIIRVGDNSTLVKLEAEGDRGVGIEQAEACKSCANYGAGVSLLPQAMGKVYKGHCFEPACNANKIAARMQAEKEATAPTEIAASIKEKSSAEKAAPAEPKAVSVSEGEKVKAYREKIWRTAMKREIVNAPDVSGKYLVSIALIGGGRHIKAAALSKAFAKLSGQEVGTNLFDTAKMVYQISPAVLAQMTTLLAASAMEELDVHNLKHLANHHQLDLKKHWALDKEFLDLLTKSEIEFIAKEIGLDQLYGDGFKKLMNEKKPDLIEKLLSIKEANYSAIIPKVLNY